MMSVDESSEPLRAQYFYRAVYKGLRVGTGKDEPCNPTILPVPA
jgi:hypothetical protein